MIAGLRSALLAGAMLVGVSTQAADTVIVSQGGVARWTGLDASDCGFHGKRFPAVDGDCYYAVDFRAKTGVHEIALYDAAGNQHLAAF